MTMAIARQDKARAFLDLHRNPDLFILPNAWDAASARVFERAGFSAIGTTSAGIAASLGYPDGQQIPVQEQILPAVCLIWHPFTFLKPRKSESCLTI
jgi:2-methylisocitrate lyase-like PEP mutase family enzyme